MAPSWTSQLSPDSIQCRFDRPRPPRSNRGRLRLQAGIDHEGFWLCTGFSIPKAERSEEATYRATYDFKQKHRRVSMETILSTKTWIIRYPRALQSDWIIAKYKALSMKLTARFDNNRLLTKECYVNDDVAM